MVQSLSSPVKSPVGHVWGTTFGALRAAGHLWPLNCPFPVVGTGVDPVTSRFSAGLGTNVGRGYNLGKITNLLVKAHLSSDLSARCYALLHPFPRSYGHVVGTNAIPHTGMY
jgi:hypothetical protein